MREGPHSTVRSVPCGACGHPASVRWYDWVDLCEPCKRLAYAWCWRKLQGIEEYNILPWHGDVLPGQSYLCILCGYWHWTSHTDEPAEDITARAWELNRYFARTSFHINIARGWSRIRYADVTEEVKG